MIDYLKVYIFRLEVFVGIRSNEGNLEDIKEKCAIAHSRVMKELECVQGCEEEAHKLLSFFLIGMDVYWI